MSIMFDHIPGLTVLQRESAKARYRFLLAEYRYRSWLYAILFYTLRITMTVGSLTVPALLSLKVDGSTGEAALYWTTWAISLAVTTSNGLMTLFKLDKRFFMLHGVAERLRTETWQFLTLSGRYSGHYNSDESPTHTNQYVHYCTNIEKIRMRHMDDEYISMGEGDKPKSVQGAAAPATVNGAQLPSSTPGTGIPNAVPNLPPVGTMLPTFMSPTRTTDVPTPPKVVSRRPSYNILMARQAALAEEAAQASRTYRASQSPPRVGTTTVATDGTITTQDAKEPTQMPVSGRDDGATV